jgi:hypothetical protein
MFGRVRITKLVPAVEAPVLGVGIAIIGVIRQEARP